MKKILLLTIGIILVASYGCSNDDLQTDVFSAKIEGDKLVLANLSGSDVFYFAVDQEELALIDWAPSVSADQPKVSGNQTIKVPLTDISGYSDNTKVIIVHYWNAIVEAGQSKPGEIKIHRLEL
ncbi:MAG: hypothetical protein ABJG47_18470 [Ekhidna sp.]